MDALVGAMFVRVTSLKPSTANPPLPAVEDDAFMRLPAHETLEKADFDVSYADIAALLPHERRQTPTVGPAMGSLARSSRSSGTRR